MQCNPRVRGGGQLICVIVYIRAEMRKRRRGNLVLNGMGRPIRAGGRVPTMRVGNVLRTLAASAALFAAPVGARGRAGALLSRPAPADPNAPIKLAGQHARQQLAVTARLNAEQVRDVT